MNDVLPKPFTKEGLIAMLEKHLIHLKKPAHGEAAAIPAPVQALSHTPGRQSLKDEDSPGKSPATTSNWNSPNQVPGVSPVASVSTEDYMSTIQPSPGLYVPGSMQASMSYGPPPINARQANQHRRQISEISGGEDVQQVAQKRAQMYPPSMQPQINPMQRPR